MVAMAVIEGCIGDVEARELWSLGLLETPRETDVQVRSGKESSRVFPISWTLSDAMLAV
jgi:hypothetical protein